MSFLTENLIFGLILSLAAFEIGIIICSKIKLPIFNPLLIAILLVICFLLIFNIDYDTYNRGGQFINMFLGPATVVLAVPLYKQINLLKKYFIPIFIGILVGSIISILSIILISNYIGFDSPITIALIPKSVTTPIGVEITNQLGGITSITVLAIIISGIVGAMIGPVLCNIFKIKNKIAIGISFGTSSHAMGTSKALEIGETEGAMSSLSIGIAGILTVFLSPIIFNLLSFLIL